MPKIDDTAYAHGRGDFAQGVSLRAIYEQSAAADDGRYNEEREAREFSRLLGFADALIEQLRRPVVVNVGEVKTIDREALAQEIQRAARNNPGLFRT